MNSRKSILFHYSMLNIGGAERSTLRLINILVKNDWDVTLVLNVGNGKLENKLDDKIKLVHFFPKPWKSKVVNQKTKLRSFAYLIIYFFPIFFYTFLSFIKKCSFLFKKYDAAIISLQGLDPFFVCTFVKAKRKYLYLRSDLTKLKKKQVAENIINFNHLLDGYLCVSKTVLESLDSININFKKKANVLYNILDIEEVKLLGDSSKDPYKDIRNDSKILVTVCRMSDKSKAIFRQIDIAEALKAEGLNFKWIFVGEGSDLGRFKTLIDEKKLNNLIFPVGEKNNPYPYIKHADIVCVLSNYEGLSGVVNEAKILGKSIIATEFSGIYEQIEHGENGFIVKNNLESIIIGLKQLIKDDYLRTSLQNNFLGSGIGDNHLKIEKLSKIISQ
jgi:glycosyltransferase involved in cell wall biosynthesis